MAEIKISVLIPFRNADHVLKRAVDSVLTQDISFELILVENQNQRSNLAKKLAANHPQIKLVHEPQIGIVHALNSGLKHCSGEYIARMDADDEMLPGRLRKQSEFLDANPHSMLVSGMVVYRCEGITAGGYSIYVDQINSIHSSEDIRKYQFIESPVAHPSVMFRKAAIDRDPLYREGDFPEDYELWLHWLEQYPDGFAKIPDAVLIWHDSEQRLSRTHVAYREDAFMHTRLEYLVRYLNKHHSHKAILIAGVGKKAKKKIRIMQAAGLTIHAITDLRQRKLDNLPFIAWDNLPEPGAFFLVSLVSNRGSWREIEAHLRKRNYRNEIDFILST